MGSLLKESLDFLADNIELSRSDPDEAVYRLEERALRFHQYASKSALDEDLVIVDDVTDSECDDTEPNSVTRIETEAVPQTTPAGTSTALPPIPNIAGVDKETLTNLLMSWFYAGYYTGLAEKQASSNSS
jgi:hypothetical protein